MFKCLVQFALVGVGTVCLLSCSSANNKPFSVKFSADSSAIVFSGIDAAGLLTIKNTPPEDTTLTGLITVLETPGENDTTGMEHPLKGEIKATDSTVVFTPEAGFVKGKTYLVSSYLNVKFADSKMLWSGKLGKDVKPREDELKR